MVNGSNFKSYNLEKLEKTETFELNELLQIFLVINKAGQFFRAKGLGGGLSWVNSAKQARIYTKIGPARSCVTFYTQTWKDHKVNDVARVVQIDLSNGIILDETKRVNKIISKKENLEEARKERQIQQDKEYALANFERAKKRLEE